MTPTMSGGGGRAEVETAELHAFASRVAEVNDAVERLTAALRGLQGAGMSVGSGLYAPQIVEFYRGLIGTEAASAVDDAVAKLEAIRGAVAGSADQWDTTEQDNVSTFQQR